MSSVGDAELMRERIAVLGRLRSARLGVSGTEARRSIARDMKVGVGTIRGLAEGTRKRVEGWLQTTTTALLIREYERHIAALSHELEALRRSGADPRSAEISEVETHLAAARRIIAQVSAGRA